MTFSAFTLKNAAMWSKGLPHQDDAWDWLQNKIPRPVLKEFMLRYRNEHKITSLEPQYALPQQAVALIKELENFRSAPYLDSEKTPTIGYGTTRYPDGKAVTLSDKRITIEQAEAYLLHHIKTRILPVLHNSIPCWGAMNDNQRSALISFAYNTGENFMSLKSGYNTIQSHLNTRSWQLIPQALNLYINPGSESEEGLRKRRKMEAELWNGQGKHAKPR